MPLDLKIQNATLIGHAGLQTIGIQGSLITEVGATVATPASEQIDINGKLVLPGFVDPHLHLDTALLLEKNPAKKGTYQEALQHTSALKRSFTVDDIQSRARRVIENEIAFGTTAIRAHVEVDPVLQLTSLIALLPLKEEYAWGTTLQLCAFVGEGITNQLGTQQLLSQALNMGADLIGSAPGRDNNPEQNIKIIFDQAQEFDVDVDFHLDFTDDSAPLLLPIVARETTSRGWQNRVCLGHMTRLAGLTPAQLMQAATMLSEAGISVLALPSSDLYMMGRSDTHNVRRGVAPIHTLADMGVNSAIASSNIQNSLAPFGDGDPLKNCNLLAQTLQLGTPERHAQCLEMATTRAAQAIGIHNHGIKPGSQADLIIVNARSVSQAIAEAPPARVTLKDGYVVSQTDIQKNLIPR